MTLFGRLFGAASPDEEAAHGLYAALVGQARRSEFYSALGVADTVDGRFDMIVLHAALLLRRLTAEGRRSARLAQALFDLMFADMDRNLREMGVGDMGVGKRIKQMAKAFYGRAAAYEAALAEPGDAALAEALARNLYRGSPPQPETLAALAVYVRRQRDLLAAQGLGELMAGRVAFGEPPGAQEIESDEQPAE